MAGFRIAGIDVGLKRSRLVVLEGRRVVYVGDLRFDLSFDFAGVDAPLSLPGGGLRECERELWRRGIRVLPPNFIREVALKGMEVAEELRGRGVKVYEVYPYATRVILNIAPYAKKRRREGRGEIEKALRRFLDFERLETHDDLDAAISALTVKLYLEGKGEKIGGRDCSMLIPLQPR